ncbi:Leucine Rich repeats (2 copies) [compost metagenome]
MAMSATLQIVSGLPSTAPLLRNLRASLLARGYQLRRCIELLNTNPDECANHQAIGSSTAILLVLPILGDNDLPSEQIRMIQHWRDTQCLTGRRIFVLLKGDRHVSDEFVIPSYPVHIKLRKLFYFLSGLSILPIKLDVDTTERIAAKVTDELEASIIAPCKAWDYLVQLTGKSPYWDPDRKRLDFDDKENGSSLLYEIPTAQLNAIFHATQALAPRVLKLNLAHLSETDIMRMPATPSVLAAELNSNCMSLQSVSATFPECGWISLGANGLTTLDLTTASPALHTLLAYKNSLEEWQWPTMARYRLKHLSLYRNRFRHLEWPAEQTDIERLNLGANPIEALPEQLAHARHLRYLGIARTHIRHLPDWIFELPALAEIDISHIEDRLPSIQLQKLTDSGITLIKKPT